MGLRRGSSRNNSDLVHSDALVVPENHLSLESFGIPEKSNSKIYTNSTASIVTGNINSGSSHPNQAVLNRNDTRIAIKSKFYKTNTTPHES